MYWQCCFCFSSLLSNRYRLPSLPPTSWICRLYTLARSWDWPPSWHVSLQSLFHTWSAHSLIRGPHTASGRASSSWPLESSLSAPSFLSSSAPVIVKAGMMGLTSFMEQITGRRTDLSRVNRLRMPERLFPGRWRPHSRVILNQKLDGCIVWNELNRVFASKRSAISAQAVYFLHSTRLSVTWFNSRWWLAACDWVMSVLSAVL